MIMKFMSCDALKWWIRIIWVNIYNCRCEFLTIKQWNKVYAFQIRFFLWLILDWILAITGSCNWQQPDIVKMLWNQIALYQIIFLRVWGWGPEPLNKSHIEKGSFKPNFSYACHFMIITTLIWGGMENDPLKHSDLKFIIQFFHLIIKEGSGVKWWKKIFLELLFLLLNALPTWLRKLIKHFKKQRKIEFTYI